MKELVAKMMADGTPPAAIAKELNISEQRVHELVPEAMTTNDAFLERINGTLTPEKFIEASVDESVKKLADTGDVEEFFDNVAPAVGLEMVKDALTSSDPKVRASLQKEVMDRSLGKARQTININARYERMTRDEMLAKARGKVPLLNDPNIVDVTPEEDSDDDS